MTFDLLSAAAPVPPSEASAPAAPAPAPPQRDRDETPDLGPFYGREHELATLAQWLLHDGCRVVAVVGLGGVGKTALAATVLQHSADRFDIVLWRSLLNAPPLPELLRALLGTLSAHQAGLPATPSEQIDLLIEYLRRRRCLLVLDNLESILQGGETTLGYRAGYAEYGQLLLRLGQTRHRSCVLLTSREVPPELTRPVGEASPQQAAVRVMTVRGLEHVAAEAILHEHGVVGGQVAAVVQHYDGHPLALKLVADTIRDFYAGDVAAFLDQDVPIFADVRAVLDQQFARLGCLEQEILVWLAIAREPTPLSALQTALLGLPGRAAVLEAVQSLRRRSLLELHGDGLSLQNVVLEYVTGRLVAHVGHELIHGGLDWIKRYALLQTNAKEYVRQSQVRLVVQPIAQRVAQAFGDSGVREHVAQVLDQLRRTPRMPSYAGGNLVNVLLGLGVQLRSLDFSQLCVWQADLRNAEAQDVSFAGADLAGSRFSDTFASITGVHFTPDGERLLGACADGTLRLWRVRDGQPLGVFVGHVGVVWAVAASPDGRLCASGGDDRTVRVWDLERGQTLYVLREHTHTVTAVAWSPDGSLLASGSRDQTVRVWDLASGRCVKTLRGHHDAIYAVAFAPPGAPMPLLASGGADLDIHVWDVPSGKPLHKLNGHERRINSLAWSPDGSILVSSGSGSTPRIWDAATWQQRDVLTGHTRAIQSLAYSADGATIVTGSYDCTLRVWDAQRGQTQRVLHGHDGWIHGVACSPDGVTAASGGADQTARIWNIHNGHELHRLDGHSAWIPALAFAAGGNILASGHWDTMVRVWDLGLGALRHTLRGHTDYVTCVTFDRDGVRAASGSADAEVIVWNLQTGQQQLVLDAHGDAVASVAFHPRQPILASGSHDRTVRIWNSNTGQLVQVLSGHTERVKAVAFSPDGRVLASGSQDHTVQLWATDGWRLLQVYRAPAPGGEISSLAFNHAGTHLAVGHYEGMIDLWDVGASTRGRRLLGHSNLVASLAWTPDDARLVSGSHDTTIRVWQVATGHQQHSWVGHAIRTMALALRPPTGDQATPLLASSGCDDEIKFWDLETATRVQTLRAAGPYAGMNIAAATGLNQTQRLALLTLGAIDEQISLEV